jgi:hypothetical protein
MSENPRNNLHGVSAFEKSLRTLWRITQTASDSLAAASPEEQRGDGELEESLRKLWRWQDPQRASDRLAASSPAAATPKPLHRRTGRRIVLRGCRFDHPLSSPPE